MTLKMKRPFRYAQADFLTQVVVMCDPTCYQLDHIGTQYTKNKKITIYFITIFRQLKNVRIEWQQVFVKCFKMGQTRSNNKWNRKIMDIVQTIPYLVQVNHCMVHNCYTVRLVSGTSSTHPAALLCLWSDHIMWLDCLHEWQWLLPVNEVSNVKSMLAV